MIKGFRFTNQLANAEVDARIHQEFLNKNDGIFYGMELSYTNSSVTIAEGLCEIAGRPITVIDSETVAVSTESLYCLLILEIDLSKESTKDTFNQASFKLLTSSTSYPTVTQQDINKYNGTGTVYQLEFARFRSSSTGISDFKDTRQFLDFAGIYAQIKADCKIIIDQIKQELASVEDGSLYLLKSNIAVITGTASFDTNGNAIVNYPDGFTKNNCVVISFMTEGLGTAKTLATGSVFDSSNVIVGSIPKYIALGDSNIIININNIAIINGSSPTVGSTYPDMNYKIVLMKIL